MLQFGNFFYAKQDPKAIPQFPTSLGGLTMTLLGSWMTYNSLILFSFQQSIWISFVVPKECISPRDRASSSE